MSFRIPSNAAEHEGGAIPPRRKLRKASPPLAIFRHLAQLSGLRSSAYRRVSLSIRVNRTQEVAGSSPASSQVAPGAVCGAALCNNAYQGIGSCI